MARRIAAGLLALVLLISIFPTVLAEEDNKIYDIGDTIWVLCGSGGFAEEPTAETVENGYWVQSMIDGEPVTIIDCGMEIHEHAPSCYEYGSGALICGKVLHTAYKHSVVCGYKYKKYQWVVMEKEQEPTNPGGDGDGTGDGLDSDGSGENDALGDLNFVVHNKDLDGNPVVGSKFLLAGNNQNHTGLAFLQNQYAVQEMQTLLQQQQQEQQAKIQELQDAGDPEALTAYIAEANAQNQRTVEILNEQSNVLSAKTTDAEGNVYFRSLEKYLCDNDRVEGEENPTWIWYLVQDTINSELYALEVQKPKWEVKIVQTGDKTYQLSFTQVNTEATMYVGEGYDATTGVLTYINSALQREIQIIMRLVDQDGKELQRNGNITANATLTGPEDYSQMVTFSEEKEENKWSETLKNLEWGIYTLQTPQPSNTLPGYTYQRTECILEVPPDTPGEGPHKETTNTLTLTGTSKAATFTVTHYYYDESQTPETTAPTEEPEKPTEYTIIVKTVDENGNPVTGATVALTGSGIAPNVSGNTHTFTVSTDTVEADDYVLQETAAPAGHELCEDQYTVSVKANGDVILSKGNFIQRLFTRTNLADNGGTETVTFVHNKKTAAITLNGGVLVDVDPLCWNVEDTRNEFRNKKQDFVLEWTASDGSIQKETLSLGQETKAFTSLLPYGTTYKVYPANASGYSYSIQNVKNDTYTGTVGEKNTLSVSMEYTIVHGEALNLYFTKVAARTGKALAGAKFALNDSNGQVLCYYTTKEGGAIDVEGMIDQPGNYTLKEIKAPEEYDLLRKPIEIAVTVGYQSAKQGGVPVMQQCLYEEVEHRSVVDGPDGTYWIKNTATADNPKTGDDAGMWMAVLLFSTLSLTVLILETGRRKRRR